MARTESTMLPLGTPAPGFQLPDLQGEAVGPGQAGDSQALLVLFICNHCPFVQHIGEGLAALGRDYMPRGVAIAAISSNDTGEYPEDGPEGMRQEAERFGYPFPYLFDRSQEVAKAFRAACTPDFFLFDSQRRLAYRGQFDGSRPGNGEPVTGRDLRAALDALLEGREIPSPQKPSVGCNIKWRAGNEPDYYRAA